MTSAGCGIAHARQASPAAARGIRPISRSSAKRARGPEMRTTAIAAGGRPEESAKMVSRSVAMLTAASSCNQSAVDSISEWRRTEAADMAARQAGLPHRQPITRIHRCGIDVHLGSANQRCRLALPSDVHQLRRIARKPPRPRDQSRICCSTSTIRSTGGRGDRRRWPRPSAPTSRSCSRSAMRPATGATSWRTRASRTTPPRR